MLTIFHCDFLVGANCPCRDYTQDIVSPAISQVMHIMLTFFLTGCPQAPRGANGSGQAYG
jgi:hypothetical protein